MSKRRLNKQQTRRVQHVQQKFQEENFANLYDGLVITRFGRNAEVETPEGSRYICSIRPNIDSLVAGDKVRWLQENATNGVIVSREVRQSTLHRQDKREQIKIVAANVTQVVIMLAPEPAPSFLLLDTYLMMAQNLGLNPLLALNKIDLPCEALQQTLKTIYAPLGYSLFFLKQQNEATQNCFREMLNNQTSVIVGQSGVGKSSLVTRLLPDASQIQIAAISEQSKLGKHTTSHSRFYHLPNGGALIDSPGIREFNPVTKDRQSVTQGFVEFTPLASRCRFRDCKHQNTPGCAVCAALQENKIQPSRYRSFIKLLSALPAP